MFDSLDKKIYLINIVALLILSLIITGLLCVNLVNQKEYLEKEAKNKTEATAKFILSDLERFIFGAEELMEGINAVEQHILEDENHDEEIDKVLFQSMRDHILNILVINKEAKIIHWTLKNVPYPDISDREYVNYHLNQIKSTKTFIGDPNLSKVRDKRWFLPISKAYYENGELKNIIVIILDLDYFNKRYKKHSDNENSSIFQASNNGEIYMRYPYKYEYIGKKIKEIESFGKERVDKKHFDIPSPLDNKKRIATLVKSDIYPIITGASLLTSDVLEPWETQKRNTITIAVLLAIGFILLIVYYTRLQKKLITLSQRDSLTKLLNRGYFTKLAQNEFKRAKRVKGDFCIVMLDIDNFKQINDTFGHHKGDKVIKKLACEIKTNIRDIDLSARYGGEEFIILLGNANIDTAFKVATRIKDSFAKEQDEKTPSTTVSIGISQFRNDDKSLENVIKRADKLMYTSKNSGKNTISI